MEITEQVFIKDYEACINTINKLSEMGFTISLDDFGTGYSSLSYLANLPIDILKIDKSFVDNIISDDYSLSLLKGIVHLAHLIGMNVIAEGVESQAQLNLLTDLKSDLIQGYFYSRPMHGDDVESFVKEKMRDSMFYLLFIFSSFLSSFTISILQQDELYQHLPRFFIKLSG